MSCGSLSSHTVAASVNQGNVLFSAIPTTPSMVADSLWYLDSGATAYMTGEGGEFQSFTPYLKQCGIAHKLSCPHTYK